VSENEDIIPFRSSMVAFERSLFFSDKGAGQRWGINRKARLKPYFFTFIMKNLKF
jgi:hypothetical protein